MIKYNLNYLFLAKTVKQCYNELLLMHIQMNVSI